jgi:hypothetical protein
MPANPSVVRFTEKIRLMDAEWLKRFIIEKAKIRKYAASRSFK